MRQSDEQQCATKATKATMMMMTTTTTTTTNVGQDKPGHFASGLKMPDSGTPGPESGQNRPEGEPEVNDRGREEEGINDVQDTAEPWDRL